jgi:ribonuclease R
MRGSGTVHTQEGAFHIPGRHVAEAMNGDRVFVRRVPGLHDGMPVGAVAGVVERAHSTFAATFVDDGRLRVLMPLDERLCHDFIVEAADRTPQILGVSDGDLVSARILQYPTRDSAGVACVERRIERESTSQVAIEAIISSHDLSCLFDPEVLEQAQGLRLDVAAALAEPGRRDIRERFVVTVDPDDARDYDDALSLEPLDEGGWLLGVHIADVSAYVAPDSPIDLAARTRATSVYLADRVIPMLPEELSCDLCSLVAGQDRLAMTVDIRVDARGRVQKADIYPSVIRSNGRFTYREVDAILAGGQPDLQAHPDCEGRDLAAHFAGLDQISRLRQGLRRERGAIEFVSSEAKVRLDEQGMPTGVDVRRSTAATSLVEEAMLAANEAVARRLVATGLPCPFRVHEPPAHDSMVGLVGLLQEMGCLAPEAKAGLLMCDAHAVQSVLDQVAGKPSEELVSSLLLRSMKRATYEPENLGHYGLGAPAYCHFTSPIRRYPDLMVHRILKAVLSGPVKSSMRRELAYSMPGICAQSSKMERVAADCASLSQAVKIAEYMEGFIGQVFDGVVVGVQPFGMFVRLGLTQAQGLLHTRDLGGEWDFDETRMELSSREGVGTYRLGMPIEVRVRSCDVFRGRVVFALP